MDLAKIEAGESYAVCGECEHCREIPTDTGPFFVCGCPDIDFDDSGSVDPEYPACEYFKQDTERE